MPNPAANPRLKALRAALAGKGLDAIVLRGRKNIRYLSGFDGSYGALIVDRSKAVLVTDGRYAEAAGAGLDGIRLEIQPTKDVPAFFSKLYADLGYAKLGFEGAITVAEHESLKKATRKAKTKLEEAGGLVADLRRTKDDAEVKTIAKAARIADKMMKAAWDAAKPGMPEAELSKLVRRAAEDFGASGESFDNIVAAGPSASRPHHHPGKRKLRKGDMLTIDLGAVVDGYCSDLTRTPVLGGSSRKFEEIYAVCLDAQQAAVRACKAGVSGKELDAVAREIIAAAGYGAYFNHGLGHGVGMDIHEGPRLSPASADVLRVGDVVTIEPGIYIPGFGGLRIEDLLVVGKDKSQVLSKAPRAYTVLPC